MGFSERRISGRTSPGSADICRVKHLATGEVYQARVADLSLKGLHLNFPSATDLDRVTDQPGNLLILECSTDESRVKLTGRSLIVVWQNGLDLGCSFVD